MSLYVYENLFVSPEDLDVVLTLTEFKIHIHTFYINSNKFNYVTKYFYKVWHCWTVLQNWFKINFSLIASPYLRYGRREMGGGQKQSSFHIEGERREIKPSWLWGVFLSSVNYFNVLPYKMLSLWCITAVKRETFSRAEVLGRNGLEQFCLDLELTPMMDRQTYRLEILVRASPT